MTIYSPRQSILLLVLLTLGAYYPTFFAPLNSLDDLIYAEQLLNQTDFIWQHHLLPGGNAEYYRPLLTLTFEIDRAVGGGSEMFMHSMNIFLHLSNVLLLYFLARAYCQRCDIRPDWVPVLAAALFCLHPINTEAVNWISGRTDLLAANFVIFSFLSTLKMLDKGSLWWAGSAALGVFLGSLCKETALFIVPGILLLLWKPPLPSPHKRGILLLLLLLLVAIGGYLILRWYALDHDRGLGFTARLVTQAVSIPIEKNLQPSADVLDQSISFTSNFPWFDFSWTIIKCTGFYVTKLFQPFPLNFAITKISDVYLIPGIIFLAFVPLWLRRVTAVNSMFLVSAALGSSALLVVLTRLAWTPVAERYLYAPSGFFVIGITIAVTESTKNFPRALSRSLGVFSGLILVVLVVATAARNRVWQDNLTLYTDTVRKSPDFAPAKNQLAHALYTHGRGEEAATLLAGIRLDDNQQASLNQAAALRQDKRFEEARQMLIGRLKNPGTQEAAILELLLGVNSDEMMENAISISDENLRVRMQESLQWLKRLEKISYSPFVMYRQGFYNMRIGNKSEAQRCFLEAANGFPSGSLYKEPARKLAEKLAQ